MLFLKRSISLVARQLQLEPLPSAKSGLIVEIWLFLVLGLLELQDLAEQELALGFPILDRGFRVSLAKGV